MTSHDLHLQNDRASKLHFLRWSSPYPSKLWEAILRLGFFLRSHRTHHPGCAICTLSTQLLGAAFIPPPLLGPVFPSHDSQRLAEQNSEKLHQTSLPCSEGEARRGSSRPGWTVHCENLGDAEGSSQNLAAFCLIAWQNKVGAKQGCSLKTVAEIEGCRHKAFREQRKPQTPQIIITKKRGLLIFLPLTLLAKSHYCVQSYGEKKKYLWKQNNVIIPLHLGDLKSKEHRKQWNMYCSCFCFTTE